MSSIMTVIVTNKTNAALTVETEDYQNGTKDAYAYLGIDRRMIAALLLILRGNKYTDNEFSAIERSVPILCQNESATVEQVPEELVKLLADCGDGSMKELANAILQLPFADYGNSQNGTEPQR